MTHKDLRSPSRTDPSELIRLRDSIYAPDLLIAAAGCMDLFTVIHSMCPDFREVCAHFGLDERCADVMLTYFVSLELITIVDGTYTLTEKASEFLTSTSPRSLLPYYATQKERPIVEKMMHALKTGEPQSWGAKKDEPDWAKAMEDPGFADRFTAGMDSRGAFYAPGIIRNFDFGRYGSVLDVGGASGIYVASILQHYPDLTGGILEKSPVDRIAEVAVLKKGMQDKIRIYEGDMFESIPTGFDIHLFSHVLHDWNMEQNTVLIRNSFGSLNRGGVIMIHDAHLNADKTGPLSVAEYSVLLMFSTCGKSYSVSELGEAMEAAGFTEIRETKTTGNRSIITGHKN